MIVSFVRLVGVIVAGRITDGKFFLRMIFVIGVGRTVFVGMTTFFMVMLASGWPGAGRQVCNGYYSDIQESFHVLKQIR